jgi:hypothetical protein
MSSTRLKTHRILALVGLASAAACVAWILWQPPAPQSDTRPAAPRKNAPTSVIIDPADPSVDFTTFQHVLQTGGCETTRPVAIEWLDRHAAQLTAPDAAEASAIFAMLAQNGHPKWDHGYRQHIFNSAFNALHLTSSAENLTRILHHLALEDRDLTLRLYALQHLGIQREHGRLTGSLAEKVHATLLALAHEKNGPCAGKAISLLAIWDGTATDPADTRATAARIASDSKRPVDVRVDAIHAAEAQGLEAARLIAADTTAPVILRKAAIARIGDHGDSSDLDSLDQLTRENHRIAQAAAPALAHLRHRLATPAVPAPLPF